MNKNDIIEKTDIKEMTAEALAAWLADQGEPSYRAGQIFRWVYGRQIDDFNEMTDLSKNLRAHLSATFSIARLKQADVLISKDGSKKFLFSLADGQAIETVLIPEKGHYTLCISSQVGCAMGCRFCKTAESGFIRNLTRAEILNQVRDASAGISPDDSRQLRNIVLMGMGEPLANYDTVVSAVNTLTDTQAGFGLANRRVTLSTSGLVNKMEALGRETAINLAVSLNATDNETRSRLMPINDTYPIETLIEACRKFPLKSRRMITMEYILMKGVNDSRQDAVRLAKLLHPVRAKINLIPFNEHDGCDFKRPAESDILQFQGVLTARHYTAVIRRSKGEDIMAACGQLRARGVMTVFKDSRGQGVEGNNY